MAKVRYVSWNMLNLGASSMTRSIFNLSSGASHLVSTVYSQMLNHYKVDVLGMLEVTVGAGDAALQKIKDSNPGYDYTITTVKNYPTRKGEFSAVLFKTGVLNDGATRFDLSQPNEEWNFPDRYSDLTEGKTKSLFVDRVPVVFKIPFSNPANKVLQIITWHAAQPANANPLIDLAGFALGLQFCINRETGTPGQFIDKTQPLIFSGDFNFETAPQMQNLWNIFIYQANDPVTSSINNYLRLFKGSSNGSKTTLVGKDPGTWANKPRNVAAFEDLLKNAYDNILVNESAIVPITPIDSFNVTGVINHIGDFVAGGKPITTIVDPGTGKILVKELIDNGNKISDHCAVGIEITLKP
jgi:hypothetical protein